VALVKFQEVSPGEMGLNTPRTMPMIFSFPSGWELKRMGW